MLEGMDLADAQISLQLQTVVTTEEGENLGRHLSQ